MKTCNYFKEQIILKFYNEEYDVTLNEHLKNCNECNSFFNDITNKFSFNISDSEKLKMNNIKNNIIKDKKDYTFVKWSYSIAASLLILFLTIHSINFLSNNSIEQKTTSQNIAKGGETNKISDIKFTVLDEFDTQIYALEEQLNNFYKEENNEIF